MADVRIGWKQVGSDTSGVPIGIDAYRIYVNNVLSIEVPRVNNNTFIFTDLLDVPAGAVTYGVSAVSGTTEGARVETTVNTASGIPNAPTDLTIEFL